jgi:glycosyltransferase involved in cell wall biosynthesis
MKVGLVGTHAANGAGDDSRSHAGDRLPRLAKALAARGADVTVYSCQPDGWSPDSEDVGYRVVSLPVPANGVDAHDESDAGLAPIMGQVARFLAARWASDRPDVVHAGAWTYGVAAQLAADRHDIPSVQSLSQLSGAVQRRQGRHIGPVARARFERLLARSATRVTAACTEDVLELVKLGCPRSRASVLPEAVDVDEFSHVGPAAPKGGQHRVIAVAREFLPHKGLDDLIRAMPRVPSAELVIVGGPRRDQLGLDPGARRLRGLAADVGIRSRFHLTGWIPPERLPPLLRSADAFASPSWYEPFGLPVLEAMACGVPVVASDAGGMLDTVIHDVTGMLVPARNSRALATTLAEVLQVDVLRNGMGSAGRTRAVSRYGWDRIAVEAEVIYERAIADHRGFMAAKVASMGKAVS